MAEPDIIKTGHAVFETEGRLLQELGERLVTNADVALVELIKNAYDADSATCLVSTDGSSITVMDDGHGITEEEFLGKWMRIATGGKQKEQTSRKYGRTMTGAKGIGRFAVRYLGRVLTIETVADDQTTYNCRTKLSATFDWELIDQSTDLREAEIDYEVSRVDASTPRGTTLTIGRLRDPDDIDFGKQLRNEVLSIVSPIGGLDRGRFGSGTDGKEDPGFTLDLPVSAEAMAEDMNLASAVLDHYYARVVIEHYGDDLTFTIRHKDGRELLKESFTYTSRLSRGLHADIRYFPRRAGMFQGTEVNGKLAWHWIRTHCGVGVVDHGFRVRPYGFSDDDWIHLLTDAAHNERSWRGKLMKEHFPISQAVQDMSKEMANPMLYLPGFHQLVGAVFVESNQTSSAGRPTDLTPAINREGYIQNEAYEDLVDIVRTGMELLALVDHREKRQLQEEDAKAKAAALRSDFRQAVRYIQELPSLTDEDKARLTTEYSTIAKQLDNVEDYYQEAGQRMDTMALLGVLAGFMTHEARKVVAGFDSVISRLKSIAEKDKSLGGVLQDIKATIEEFRGQIEYSTMFIGAIQDKNVKPGPIPVAGQIELVTERFSLFCAERGIEVSVDAAADLRGPVLPAAVYSGVLLNLFTNALKAVSAISGEERGRHVVIKAWNEPKWHIVEVADNGIGIPPQVKKRIWDPLFTTTSGGTGNPLGSGMGLGLTLVKEIVTRMRGRIELVDTPPPEYSTCFKVSLPRK